VKTDSHLILYLSTIATCKDSDKSRAAVSILLQLYDTLSDESPLLEEFFEPENVANLFKICCETDSLLVSNDIATVLTSLYTFECELEPNLTKYKEKLTLSANNITPLSVAFLPIFNPSYLDIFQLFFRPQAHQFLHDYCSQLIMKLTPADINSLAADSDFVYELMRCFGTKDWCPHMVQIALVLARMTCECDALLFQEWENFVKFKILPLMKVIENDYGGPINTEKEDEGLECLVITSEDEEYDYYYSYEEEEEADIGQHAEMDNSDDDEHDNSAEK
jgi:hypothetical protein